MESSLDSVEVLGVARPVPRSQLAHTFRFSPIPGGLWKTRYRAFFGAFSAPFRYKKARIVATNGKRRLIVRWKNYNFWRKLFWSILRSPEVITNNMVRNVLDRATWKVDIGRSYRVARSNRHSTCHDQANSLVPFTSLKHHHFVIYCLKAVDNFTWPQMTFPMPLAVNGIWIITDQLVCYSPVRMEWFWLVSSKQNAFHYFPIGL